MTVDQLKPGMKGTGRSVFFGTEVKEFGVEVVDVMHKAWPRGDLIICRLSGQGLEESGVVAGMSGSPVYIEGKLIGAVAYAWGFAKEPLAGVTPAAQMLRIWNEPDRSGGQGGSRSGRLSEGIAPTGLSPLPLPVALSGFTPALAELIQPAFSKFGLTPVAAAGAASTGAADTSGLVPGAAVGIALIDGDVRVAAMGTLTCREGKRIIAFGHPMLGAGNIRMPMVGGVIHSVVPSEMSSFKLFSPTAPLGTINQDRLAGIGGNIGAAPEMLPVTAVISSPSGLDTYRFRIVELEDLAPTLAAAGLTDVVYQTEGNLEEMTLASRMTVRLSPAANRQSQIPADSLVVEHRFSGTNPAEELFRTAQSELGALYSNRFLPAPVASVGFDLRFTPGRNLAYLLSARPDRVRVRPGDSVNVTLGLRDYRGSNTEVTVAIGVPEPTPEGKLRIIIAPRDSLFAFEAMRAPATLEPGSFARLVELLSQTGRENELVAAGFITGPGLTLAGEEFPTPPPSLRSVLLNRQADEPVTATNDSPVIRQTLRLDRVISGVVKLDLEVKR
ncbi:MAG TPA: SpoIVB peptidase S55 domain-containing protein [bacterium]|nr:SpoIVB peptidase S55 domain-containing protein [bacterium]